jgi:hypothetical protein
MRKAAVEQVATCVRGATSFTPRGARPTPCALPSSPPPAQDGGVEAVLSASRVVDALPLLLQCPVRAPPPPPSQHPPAQDGGVEAVLSPGRAVDAPQQRRGVVQEHRLGGGRGWIVTSGGGCRGNGLLAPPAAPRRGRGTPPAGRGSGERRRRARAPLACGSGRGQRCRLLHAQLSHHAQQPPPPGSPHLHGVVSKEAAGVQLPRPEVHPLAVAPRVGPAASVGQHEQRAKAARRRGGDEPVEALPGGVLRGEVAGVMNGRWAGQEPERAAPAISSSRRRPPPLK